VRRQAIAMSVDGGPAERQLVEREIVAARVSHGMQHPQPFGDDLRSDAVAPEHSDQCLHG
jgi:hypothetical protein